MRSILVAALLCGVSPAAHAALTCGPARVDVGDTGRNGVVSTYVAHDPGSWAVKHTLANGTVVDRSLQYVITDYSGDKTMQWRGTLMRNPAMTMTGELMKLKSNGQPTYDEWLYKNNQLVMHSVALCQFDNPAPNVAQPSASAPTPLAPTVATAPPATFAGVDAVPITLQLGAIHVAVTLGGRPASMLLDTGANVSSISASLAADLIAT